MTSCVACVSEFVIEDTSKKKLQFYSIFNFLHFICFDAVTTSLSEAVLSPIPLSVLCFYWPI